MTAIARLSYEFERFGDAATTYFRRRASVLSVIVAFALAFAMNIDAFRLYNALAQDDALANEVIAKIDTAKLEAALANPDAAGSSPKEIVDGLKSESRRLEALGLPVGHVFFPYCAPSSSLGDLSPQDIDSRCASVSKYTYTSNLPLIGATVGAIGTVAINAYQRLSTAAGFSWIVSVLITGGLIGLGAPFWFKAYQFLIDYVPTPKSPDRTRARQPRSGVTGNVVALPVENLPEQSVNQPFFPWLHHGVVEETRATKSQSTPVKFPKPVVTVVSDPGLSDGDLYYAFLQSSPANSRPQEA